MAICIYASDTLTVFYYEPLFIAPPNKNVISRLQTTTKATKMSLSGKIALITGGSNGIGKACVQRLARDGASVAINYNRDAAAAEALVSSIGSDRAVAIQADVSSIAGVTRLVDETITKFGRIDIVMANAGMMLMRQVEDTTEQDFDSCFNLNVKAPYFLAQVCLSHYPAAINIPLIDIAEGCASHVKGRADYFCFNWRMPLFCGDARLSTLRGHKRCYRANDSRHVQGPRAERNPRQRCCSWSYGNRVLLPRKDGGHDPRNGESAPTRQAWRTGRYCWSSGLFCWRR